MVSDIFFDKKKYLSVSSASKLTGYSKDYIGQLSRHHKVDSVRVGRTWYVREESLLSYKNSPTTFDFSKNFQGGGKLAEQSQIKKSASVQPKNSNLKSKFGKLIQPVHEAMFAVDYSLLNKLLPLVVGVLFTVGLVDLTNNLVLFSGELPESFAKLNQIFEPVKKINYTNISKSISLAPTDFYNAMDDVVNLYSKKLYDSYISFGQRLSKTSFAFGKEALVVLKNPPLYIVKNLEKFSVIERKAINSMTNETISLISLAHQETFTFISDSIGGLSGARLYINSYSKENTASISNSVSIKSPNLVDDAGFAIYNKINNWISNGIYSPISSFFANQPSVTNTVYVVAKEKVPQTIPISRTPIKTNIQTNNVVTTTHIVEKVIERSVPNTISKADLEARLGELNEQIGQRFSALGSGHGGSITNVYQQIADSQKIDNLANTVISNPTITGGSITNTSLNITSSVGFGTTTVANLGVSNTSTSTFSGGIDCYWCSAGHREWLDTFRETFSARVRSPA